MLLNKEESEQRFREAHQRWGEILIEEAQEKLARALTEAERQALRDIKSLLFLEMRERALLATRTPEEAEQWLVDVIRISQKRVKREKGLLGTTEAEH